MILQGISFLGSAYTQCHHSNVDMPARSAYLTSLYVLCTLSKTVNLNVRSLSTSSLAKIARSVSLDMAKALDNEALFPLESQHDLPLTLSGPSFFRNRKNRGFQLEQKLESRIFFENSFRNELQRPFLPYFDTQHSICEIFTFLLFGCRGSKVPKI